MKTRMFLGVFLLSLILFLGTTQKSAASTPETAPSIAQLLTRVEENADIQITIMPPLDEVYQFVKKRDCEVKDGFLVISAHGGYIYIPISNLLTMRVITKENDDTILSLRFWFR